MSSEADPTYRKNPVTSGSPYANASWSSWAYACQLEQLLTLSEVNERLALEYWLQGVFGTRGLTA